MRNNWKVSVVIPAYNAEAFIVDAIRSARTQTYPIHEIIVVDDGSKDGTVAKVEQCGVANVTLIRKPNGGSASARNVGIHAATGDVIAFLDADDLWLPEKTEKQVTRMQQTGATLVYCSKSWIDEQQNPIPNRDPQVTFPEGNILADLIRGNYITSASCVLATKASLEQVGGFDESRKIFGAEDHELWLRMAHQFKMAAVQEELVRYRRHGANVTNEHENGCPYSRNVPDRVGSRLKASLKEVGLERLVRRRTEELLVEAIRDSFSRENYGEMRGFVGMAFRRRQIPFGCLHLAVISLFPVSLIKGLRVLGKKRVSAMATLVCGAVLLAVLE